MRKIEHLLLSDNVKNRMENKQRSRLTKIQDGVAAWLGRRTAEMCVVTRDREQRRPMIAKNQTQKLTKKF